MTPHRSRQHPEVAVREAVAADLVEAAQIYQSAAMTLHEVLRLRNPWSSEDARAIDLREAIGALSDLSATPLGKVIVAETGNELTGVAAVRIRDRHAHIAFLFVLPAWQGKGVGGQLLTRLREIIDAAGASVVTLVASRDPRAWQRYLRFGLHPGPPVMSLRARKPRFPDLVPGDGLESVPIERDRADVLEAVDRLDREIAGVSRLPEIARWLEHGAEGTLVRDRVTDRPVGFFIVSVHADHGRIGPVVSRTVARFPDVLSRALQMAGRHERDLVWRVDLPSVNQVAIGPLLDAGFSPHNLMPWFANGEIGRWDRYIFRDEDTL